jgi:DNA-binding transcriptional regulator of glucitol operon
VARKYLQIPALSAFSKRFFSQGALINGKLRNRFNKSTFANIISLKSWGVFKDEEDQEKQEKIKPKKGLILEEDNMFFI